MERTASDSTKRNVFNVVHIDLDSSFESGAMSGCQRTGDPVAFDGLCDIANKVK